MEAQAAARHHAMELQDSMKELKAFVDKQMKKDAALKDAAARRAKAPPAGDGNSQVSDAPPLAQDCNMHPMHSPASRRFHLHTAFH